MDLATKPFNLEWMIWKIRLIWALIRITKNPNNTTAALAVGEALYRSGSVETARKKISSQPDAMEVIQKRRMMAPVDLQVLQKYPAGSLARAYSDHMIRNNLDPNFYKTFEINSDEALVIMRMRQTHDLWHVLTGFTTSVADELGLQAFMFAQTHVPLPPMLIAAGLLKAGFKDRSLVEPILDRVSKGWKMGMQCLPIFALDWEAHWNTPVDELRKLYKVEALTA